MNEDDEHLSEVDEDVEGEGESTHSSGEDEDEDDDETFEEALARQRDEREKMALLAISEKLCDHNLLGWTSALRDVPLAKWPGITTNKEQRVIGINFDGRKLRAPLEQVLERLCVFADTLVTLSCSSNELHGPLSGPLIQRFRFLEVLCLDANQLSQTIPEEIQHLTRLKVVFLGHNSFILPSGVTRDFEDSWKRAGNDQVMTDMFCRDQAQIRALWSKLFNKDAQREQEAAAAAAAEAAAKAAAEAEAAAKEAALSGLSAPGTEKAQRQALKEFADAFGLAEKWDGFHDQPLTLWPDVRVDRKSMLVVKLILCRKSVPNSWPVKWGPQMSGALRAVVRALARSFPALRTLDVSSSLVR